MQRPRGTRDLSGDELARMRYVKETLNEVFKRYGYQEVETPIFESLELFTKESGSEIVDQIYEFEDKSGRRLALRPELTAPVVRLYNNRLKSEPKPLKVFYSGPCFRYERKQAGRWRQFSQAGAELIGSSRPESDAEIVAMTSNAASELKLKNYELRAGHINILRKLLIEGGITLNNQDPILRAIDSNDESRIEEELKNAGVNTGIQEKLKELIKLEGGPEVLEEAEELLQKTGKATETIQEFREILDYVQRFGVDNIQIDMGIARGLEYYTGFVTELNYNDTQLAGGGRYDDLIEVLGGEPTPAIGIGFGIDRIAQVLKNQGLELGKDLLDYMILPTEDSVLDESLKLAKELRSGGLITDVDLMGRTLSKALSYADSRGTKYAIIIGPKDMTQGVVTLRDMKTGDQRKVVRDQVVKELKSRITS